MNIFDDEYNNQHLLEVLPFYESHIKNMDLLMNLNLNGLTNIYMCMDAHISDSFSK
jgi:hypothetical protein